MYSALRLAGQPHHCVVRLHPLSRRRACRWPAPPTGLPCCRRRPVDPCGRSRTSPPGSRRSSADSASAARSPAGIFVDRREQAGEGPAERRGDRVARIDHVVGGGAVVGVDDHLDAVADVVDAAGALRVGIAIAGRVGVLDPEQPALVDRQVRIGVVVEERRDQADALGDAAVIEDAALGGQIVRQQRLHRSEAQREQQLASERADADAARARVGREDVVLALRIVELACLRLDEDVVVRQLAEVEARLGYRQVDGGLRRQVADEQRRQAFAGDLVHRAERQAVAVREREVLVDPVAVRQRVGVQLARRQHDLPVLAVDHVAVVVDGDEVVVGPDLLDLAERVLERLVIPERHVAQGDRVGVEVLAGQRGIARQLALLDPLEGEGVARRRDVVDDERRFTRLLVRRDHEPLQAGRVDGAADRDEQAQAERRHERPEPRLHHLIGGERDAERGGDDQHPGGRHPRMDVDVGGAGDQARRRRQQLGDRQPRAGGDDDEPAAPRASPGASLPEARSWMPRWALTRRKPAPR